MNFDANAFHCCKDTKHITCCIMKKRSITTFAILAYMAIVNIFSAFALYSYYKSTNSPNFKSSATFSMPAKWNNTRALKHQKLQQINAYSVHDLTSTQEQTAVRNWRLQAASESCRARLLIFYHITHRPMHHTSRSLGVLQRILKNSNGFLVLVVGVDLFEKVYRDWCFRLSKQCQLTVVTRDVVDLSFDLQNVDGNLYDTIMTISFQKMMSSALEETPSMCVHGVVVLSSNFIADVGFSRRLQMLPTDKVACLYANAPPMCSAEALWIPYELLGQASNTDVDIDLFVKHEQVESSSAFVESSVNVFVQRCIRDKHYSGSYAVVVQV